MGVSHVLTVSTCSTHATTVMRVGMLIPSFFAADVRNHYAPKDSIKSQMFPPRQFNPYTPGCSVKTRILYFNSSNLGRLSVLTLLLLKKKKKLLNSSSITSPVKTQQAFWAMFAAALLIQGTQGNKRVFGKGPFHAGLENCWPSLCWREARMEQAAQPRLTFSEDSVERGSTQILLFSRSVLWGFICKGKAWNTQKTSPPVHLVTSWIVFVCVQELRVQVCSSVLTQMKLHNETVVSVNGAKLYLKVANNINNRD